MTALKAEAASVVMLPRILLALDVREERVAAAAVLPVAASELRLERVAENADFAELKLAAMDCSALPAELEAEAATELAELETEARDWEMSDETEDNELSTEGAGVAELPEVVDMSEVVDMVTSLWAAHAGAMAMREDRRMLKICIVTDPGRWMRISNGGGGSA